MSDSEFSSEFGSPYQVLVDHCESAGLKFRQDPEAKAIFFSIRGSLAIYDVALFISHGDEVLQIYVTIPIATNEPLYR